MTPPATMRALLVGNGVRMESGFLPAFGLLGDRIEAVARWPGPDGLESATGGSGVPVVLDPGDVLRQVDLVVVSVAQAVFSRVLRDLGAAPSRLVLVLDPPILAGLRQLRGLRPLERFSRVVVARETTYSPQLALVRRAIDGGLIGPVQSVRLNQPGPLSSALALLRSLFGFQKVWAYWRRSGDEGRSFTFVFPGRRGGSLSELYDESLGTFVIEGAEGVITDDPRVAYTGKTIHVVHPVGDPTQPQGFSLHDFSVDLPEAGLGLSSSAIALSRILESLWSDASDLPYSYSEGVYDELLAVVPPMVPGLFDPGALIGHDLLRPISKRLARRTSAQVARQRASALPPL